MRVADGVRDAESVLEGVDVRVAVSVGKAEPLIVADALNAPLPEMDTVALGRRVSECVRETVGEKRELDVALRV